MNVSNKNASKKTSKKSIKEDFQLTLVALPGVIYLLIFNYLPLPGLAIAFKDFKPLKGIWGSEWNGLDNLKFFFTSQDALRTIRNTLLYNGVWLVLGTFCSVGLALMFYHVRSRRALKVYNTVMMIPKFMSAVMLSLVAQVFLSYRFGYINQMVKAFGGNSIDWYTIPEIWPFVLTIVQVWATVAVSSMIYYASLMGMDECMLEAAKLDGANKVQQIGYVMVPHLIPVITIQCIVNLGNLFNSNLGLFYQVPQNSGMLYPTTDVIATYTFRALQGGRLANSAAVGLVQSIAGFILIVTTNAFIRRVCPENKIF